MRTCSPADERRGPVGAVAVPAPPGARRGAGGVVTPCAPAVPTFRLPVRVYYEDTDAAGVVYYASYLRFMERARTEWLSALGFELAALEAEHGVAFAVHHLDIRYHQPARLGDRLEVTVTMTGQGRARILADQRVCRGGLLLVDARVTLACLDRTHWRPVRIPAPLATRLENPA
jgi:acyl-CoA thioester hydrolase